MRKLNIISLILIAGGIIGIVVAHHYRPLPAGYFVPGVPGAPTRLSNGNYHLAFDGSIGVLVIGIFVLWFAVRQYVRRRRHE